MPNQSFEEKINKQVVKFEKELDIYLEKDEHGLNCASYNEGLYCCLDKKDEASLRPKTREFIIKFIHITLAQCREETIKECIEILEKQSNSGKPTDDTMELHLAVAFTDGFNSAKQSLLNLIKP